MFNCLLKVYKYWNFLRCTWCLSCAAKKMQGICPFYIFNQCFSVSAMLVPLAPHSRLLSFLLAFNLGFHPFFLAHSMCPPPINIFQIWFTTFLALPQFIDLWYHRRKCISNVQKRHIFRPKPPLFHCKSIMVIVLSRLHRIQLWDRRGCMCRYESLSQRWSLCGRGRTGVFMWLHFRLYW